MRKQKEIANKYCKSCGKKMERKRFNGRLEDPTVFKKRLYCDRMCMRVGMLNIGINKSSPRNSRATAQKINELVMKRTECEKCGKDGRLDVHHKDMNYQNNNLDNLMVLCRSCHMKEHSNDSRCVICNGPMRAKGYCEKHYQRYRKYGDPLHKKRRSVCKVCGELAHAKKLCGRHYQQMVRREKQRLTGDRF